MEALATYGLIGLFIAAFVAGTLIPFNSEIVLSAVLVAGADLTTALIVATVGNTLGGLVTYYMGHIGKPEWLEKYGKIKHEKLVEIQPQLNRYGPAAATLSFVPGLGNVIILGLGFFRIAPFWSFIFMTFGKLARYAVWGYATDLVI
jgi:membrane protein YqaA with SNARE-associated domain